MRQKYASNQKTEKQRAKIVAGKPTGVRKCKNIFTFLEINTKDMRGICT